MTERDEHLSAISRALESAVETIQAIATVDPAEDYKNTGGKTPIAIADSWLTANGYENSDVMRKRAARERRADELDREIERLRLERAKL